MKQIRVFERYPLWIVFLSNIVGLAIYLTGAAILAGFGLWMSALYLLYCLGLELRLLKGHCVNCYYYGNVCGFGKGKLCAWFFKPGDPKKFTAADITWASMLPDLVVLFWPVLGGVILLVQDFRWLLVGLLVLLVGLSTSGNAIIRGSFVCKTCKQKELGCPAARLFGVER
jgi:hypothetical protein